MKNIAVILSLCFLLPGCASILTGTQQNVSVETTPAGASCELTNNDGTWLIPSTPGTITINRGYSNLAVNCAKEEFNGAKMVTSKVKSMILMGGVLGIAVDIGTGAAFDYPNVVSVDLTKSSPTLMPESIT